MAIQPYLANDIDFGAAGIRSSEVIKDFMLRQCREADLLLFVQMARIEPPKTAQDLGVDPRTIFRHLEKEEAR